MLSGLRMEPPFGPPDEIRKAGLPSNREMRQCKPRTASLFSRESDMKRRDLLGLLLLGGPLSKTIWSYQQPAGRGGQPQGPPSVEVEKLTDNLVLLRGGGGVSAVLLRGDGVTVVDTKNPDFGAPIIAAVKGLTGSPVTTIIN